MPDPIAFKPASFSEAFNHFSQSQVEDSAIRETKEKGLYLHDDNKKSNIFNAHDRESKMQSGYEKLADLFAREYTRAGGDPNKAADLLDQICPDSKMTVGQLKSLHAELVKVENAQIKAAPILQSDSLNHLEPDLMVPLDQDRLRGMSDVIEKEMIDSSSFNVLQLQQDSKKFEAEIGIPKDTFTSALKDPSKLTDALSLFIAAKAQKPEDMEKTTERLATFFKSEDQERIIDLLKKDGITPGGDDELSMVAPGQIHSEDHQEFEIMDLLTYDTPGGDLEADGIEGAGEEQLSTRDRNRRELQDCIQNAMVQILEADFGDREIVERESTAAFKSIEDRVMKGGGFEKEQSAQALNRTGVMASASHVASNYFNEGFFDRFELPVTLDQVKENCPNVEPKFVATYLLAARLLSEGGDHQGAENTVNKLTSRLQQMGMEPSPDFLSQLQQKEGV